MGREEEGGWGGALRDWRIRGGVEGISPTHSGPRRPAGLPGLVFHFPGSSLVHVGPRGVEGGRGEEERWTGRGSPGSEDQGRHRGHFPYPLSPGKPVRLTVLAPCLPGPPLAMWVLGA